MREWETFLEEASTLLTLDHEAASDAAASALAAFALDAAVLDMPEVSKLSMRLVHVLEGASPEAHNDDFHAALAVLHATLAQLRESDPSGPQYDLVAVQDAAGGPLAGIPTPSSIRPPPPPPTKKDETTWQPTVDDDMVDPFLEECHDRLESLSARLIELEARPGDSEGIRAIFRDLHTLKGSAGFVGLTKMARLAHAAEDLVGHLRDGKRTADRPVVDALLASLDVLQAIVQRAADRAPIDVDIEPVIERLRAPGAQPADRKSVV